MVTVPPCLCVAWSAPALGLDVVLVPLDWQAARIMLSVMRTATVLERLILTVPSSNVSGVPRTWRGGHRIGAQWWRVPSLTAKTELVTRPAFVRKVDYLLPPCKSRR